MAAPYVRYDHIMTALYSSNPFTSIPGCESHMSHTFFEQRKNVIKFETTQH